MEVNDGAAPAPARAQWNNKHFLITYARCDLPPIDALTALLATLDGLRATPIGIRVAQEEHDDGGLHLHVFLRLERSLRTRNARIFDIGDHHPNIQSCRDPRASFTYVSKGNNYVDHLNPDPGAGKRKWDDVVAANTVEEFWTIVTQVSPRDAVLNTEKLEYYANKRFANQLGPYIPDPLEIFSIPPGQPNLVNFLGQRLDVRITRTSIFFIG